MLVPRPRVSHGKEGTGDAKVVYPHQWLEKGCDLCKDSLSETKWVDMNTGERRCFHCEEAQEVIGEFLGDNQKASEVIRFLAENNFLIVARPFVQMAYEKGVPYR